MRSLILALTVSCCFTASSAKSVLGFPVTGGASHHATFARLGLELTERGHDFAILLSSGDTLGQARLSQPPFNKLRQIRFSGPVGVGTNEWLNDLDRDPSKASFVSASICEVIAKSTAHLLLIHWKKAAAGSLPLLLST